MVPPTLCWVPSQSRGECPGCRSAVTHTASSCSSPGPRTSTSRHQPSTGAAVSCAGCGARPARPAHLRTPPEPESDTSLVR